MSQHRWRQLTEWPLVAASALFLIAYSWEVIADLNGSAATITEAIIWATWGIFLVDYVMLLILAERRWRWFYTHLFDLLVVALPMLRPLRLLRLLTILTVLQRTVGRAFRGRVIIYVGGAAVLLVYVAALAMLDTERDAGGRIINLGDGLWWAFVTITTVGYGDYTPVTDTGRIIAVGVMLGGIALIGVVTATIASWIVQRVGEQEAVAEVLTRSEIAALTREVAALRELLEQQRGDRALALDPRSDGSGRPT